jgi:mannuronan 5-epimerase
MINVRKQSARLGAVVTGAALVSFGIAAVGLAGPASATACSSPVKYSPTSNTIYLVTPQPFTLTDIVNYCAAAPLRLIDPLSKTWELSADLVIQNGASLVLHGDGAAAGPGDVDTLRLRSLSDNLPTDVQSITAAYGTIDADSTIVESWDDATNGPDVDPSLPANAPSTAQGRAFVRAQSSLSGAGVPQTSTMTIVNSTFEYLGFYGGESYGVAYKTEGCSHTQLDVCAAVHVTGAEINSHFLHNFMGTYTWGAYGMTFSGNEYGNNIMYGLDPHDVSSYLDIEHNRFHDNGDHGMICSQKCDHLTIEYNESDHNGMVPWPGPNPDDAGDGQVHGIMIHRGVTNTTIAYNNIHDEPNGAGIAIFDSAGDSVHDNTITNTKYGIRLSVGAANNVITNNSVSNSSQYGVYMYKGSDLPENTTPNGHPTANVIAGNTFNTSGSNIIKLTEADGNIFSNNTIVNPGSSILLVQSAGTVLDSNTMPAGQQVSLNGVAGETSSAAVISPALPVKLSVDLYSVIDVTNPFGQLYSTTSPALPIGISSSGADLNLSTTGTSTKTVTVTSQPYSVLPASGSAIATAAASNGVVSISLQLSAPMGNVSFTVGGLTPAGVYAVARNGVSLTSATANSTGVITFADASAPSGSDIYTVTRTG